MNEYREDDLIERVSTAKLSIIHPLKMQAENVAGEQLNALAVNEVHLFRQMAQSARLAITVDGKSGSPNSFATASLSRRLQAAPPITSRSEGQFCP